MPYLRVRFSDYRKAASDFKKNMNLYQKELYGVIEDMTRVLESGLISGKSHDEAAFFVKNLSYAYEIPEGISDQFSSIINDYLDQLDSIQKIGGESILYARSYSGLRNYEYTLFEKLFKQAETADHDEGLFHFLLDWYEDNVVYLVSKINDMVGCPMWWHTMDTSVEKKLDVARQNLMQYKDVTKRRLREMYIDLCEAENATTVKINPVINTLATLNEYIKMLTNSLYTANGVINVSNHVEIENLRQSLLEDYNDLLSVEDTSTEQIVEFIRSEDYKNYTDENLTIVRDQIAKITDGLDITQSGEYWEYLKMVFLIMPDMSKATISSIYTGKSYDEAILEKEVFSMLKAEAKSIDFNDGKAKEDYNNYVKLLKDLSKYGEEGFKKLYSGDKRYKKYRECIKGFAKIDKFFKVLKHSEKGVEILASLLVNYSKNVELLDSLQRCSSSDPRLEAAYNRVRRKYEDKLFSAFTQTIEYAGELGEEAATKAIETALSTTVLSVVAAVEKTIDVVGEVTGEGAKVKAQYELMSYQNELLNSSGSALETSLQKLAGLKENDPDYPNALSDVKNTFAIHRRNLTSSYEKLAAASSGVKKDYYNYLSRNAAKMSISDLSKPVITFEEYKKHGE